MPEKLHQNISKQSKVDQVLYGIGGTLKKLPEAHGTVIFIVSVDDKLTSCFKPISLLP